MPTYASDYGNKILPINLPKIIIGQSTGKEHTTQMRRLAATLTTLLLVILIPLTALGGGNRDYDEGKDNYDHDHSQDWDDRDHDDDHDEDHDEDEGKDDHNDHKDHDHKNKDDHRSHKIKICHIPHGNPDNGHIIEIDKHAWDAHEDHGDFKIEDRWDKKNCNKDKIAETTTTTTHGTTTTTVPPTTTTTPPSSSMTTTPEETTTLGGEDTTTSTSTTTPATTTTVPFRDTTTTEPITTTLARSIAPYTYCDDGLTWIGVEFAGYTSVFYWLENPIGTPDGEFFDSEAVNFGVLFSDTFFTFVGDGEFKGENIVTLPVPATDCQEGTGVVSPTSTKIVAIPSITTTDLETLPYTGEEILARLVIGGSLALIGTLLVVTMRKEDEENG